MMYDGGFPFHGAGLVWLVIVALPFAIGLYFVAGRIGQNQLLWAILALIPVVNWFFAIYAFFATVLYALDRLNAMAPPAQGTMGNAPPQGTAGSPSP